MRFFRYRLIPRAAQLWQREFTVSPGQTITPAAHRVRFRERLLLARPQCRLIGYRYSMRQVVTVFAGHRFGIQSE